MCRRLLRTSALSFLIAVLAAAGWSSLGVKAEEASRASPRRSQGVALQDSTPRLKAFMRNKLKASQQVVEGLATENLELITQGATTIMTMSKEAIWETRAGAIYTQDTTDFVRTAERIVKMSKAQDVEGAALAYAQLTLQCVQCHRHVRSEKVVSRPFESPNLGGRVIRLAVSR